jgi:rubredoxin
MEYKRYMCLICGYIYDEEAGAPEDGIAPKTKWEDVAEDWLCPDCGAMKDDFEMVALPV